MLWWCSLRYCVAPRRVGLLREGDVCWGAAERECIATSVACQCRTVRKDGVIASSSEQASIYTSLVWASNGSREGV